MSRYLARFKGLVPDDPDRSWRAWAAQKLQRKPSPATEALTLFPGWAARRHHPDPDSEDAPFDIEASISGYASSCRANGQVTRSQRAFLRIAKGQLLLCSPSPASRLSYYQALLPFLGFRTSPPPPKSPSAATSEL